MLGLSFAIAFFVDASLIIAAYLYTRFVFSGYLRKHHIKQWEQLVYGHEYRSLNILSFDKTAALWRFRCESNDDLGDPRISRMRRISIHLFNTAMIAWLTLIGVFLVGSIFFVLVLK